MSHDTTLRARLIRLAADQPDLRPALLPLLRQAKDEDENPFHLYEGHEKATEEIQAEIYQTASQVASAYAALRRLMKKYDELGADDTASREIILEVWETEITKAMEGRD